MSRVAGSKRRTAPTRHVGVANAIRIHHVRLHILIRDLQCLSRLHGDRRTRAADVRRPFDQVDRPIGIDIDHHRGLKTDVEPEPRRHATTAVRTGQRCGIVLVFQRRMHRLHVADARERHARHLPFAFLGAIDSPQLQGVHIELFSQLIHHGFRRIRGIGRTRCTVSCGLGLVEHHIVTVNLHIRERVRGKNTHCTRRHRRTRISARFKLQHRFCRHDLTVALGPDLDRHIRARGRARGVELFDTAHDQFHRLAGLLGQNRAYRLQVHRNLAAKTATDFTRRHRHIRHRNAQDFGGLLLHHKLALRTRPDIEVPIFMPQHRRVVRLDIALVHSLRVELALNDDIGLLKARFRVTEFKLKMIGDVAIFVRLLPKLHHFQIIVHQRGIVLHRVEDIHDRWQQLVLHLDQVHRLFRDVNIRRRHRRYCVPLVKDFVTGHDIAGQILQIHRHLAGRRHAILGLWQIVPCHHRFNPRQRFRLAGVNAFNTGMRVRAAQDLAVQHPGHPHIGPINRPPCHLVRPIRAERTCSNDFVISRCFSHYALAPMVSAASKTARIILS